MLEYHKMTEEEKYCIARWKYPGNTRFTTAFPMRNRKSGGSGLRIRENHLYSFYDGKDLVGFINLNGEDPEVFFGIGVNPDCCGKGYGQQMTRMAWEISRTLFPGKPMYLEVRTWNQRAVRCYEKAGFHVVGEPIKQTTSIGEGMVLSHGSTGLNSKTTRQWVPRRFCPNYRRTVK